MLTQIDIKVDTQTPRLYVGVVCVLLGFLLFSQRAWATELVASNSAGLGSEDQVVTQTGAEESASSAQQSNAENGGKKGGLMVKAPNKVDFVDIEVSSSEMLQRVGLGEDLWVTDGREGRPGWSLTVMTSGLELEKTKDVIGAERMGIAPLGLVGGGWGEGFAWGSEQFFEDEQDSLMIVSAIPGFGQGEFGILLDLMVNLPANLVAGNYKGRVIFSIQ